MSKVAKKLVALAVCCFTALQFILFFPDSSPAAYNRLAGVDRYQTAVAVCQKGWEKSDTVFLVNSDDYNSAICAGPLAAKYNAPILFVGKYDLNSFTLAEIRRLGAKNIIIVGGYDRVGSGVSQALYAAGMQTIERIQGADPFATSVEIAKRMGSKQVALVSAEQYADALSIASVAASQGLAILLTKADSLPAIVKNHLENYKIERTYIIGGEKVIEAAVEKQVPKPVRLAGQNRYDTNRKVLDQFKTVMDFNKIYVAIGEGQSGYADSLSGVVLAARTASPIILSGKAIDNETLAYLEANLPVGAYITAFGGEEAVPTKILNAFDASYNSVLKTVFSQPGVYGPQTGTTTIAGSLAIEGPDITVQNTVIEGDLLIGQGVGAGRVELANVEVKGRTVVRAGSNGIVGNQFKCKSMMIDVPDGRKTVFSLYAKSKVDKLTILSDAVIDDNEATDGFLDVEIIQGRDISLAGKYNTLGISSPGVVIKMQNPTVKTLNAKSRQIITGSGTINTANITVSGVELYFYPNVTNVSKGVTAYAEGNKLPEGTTKAPATSGRTGAPINNLTAQAGNGQVTLSFSAPSGASAVSLLFSTDNGKTWEIYPLNLNAGSTGATVTGLSNGQTYSFKLEVTGGMKAGFSNVVTVTPLSEPITNLHGVAGNGFADFTFDPPAGASYVFMQISEDGGLSWRDYYPAGGINSSSVSTRVSGLYAGRTYAFRLVVFGGSRAGYSNIVSLTLY